MQNKILIHVSQEILSGIKSQIKHLAKKYKYEHKLNESQANNSLKSWIKDWIQREMPLIKINFNQASTNDRKVNEIIHNKGKEKNSAGGDGARSTDSKSIELTSEAEIKNFLINFYFEFETLAPITKPLSDKRPSFFKKNNSKPIIMPEIISEFLLSNQSLKKESSYEELEALFTLLEPAPKERINACYYSTYQKYKQINDRAQLRFANNDNPLLLK